MGSYKIIIIIEVSSSKGDCINRVGPLLSLRMSSEKLRASSKTKAEDRRCLK